MQHCTGGQELYAARRCRDPQLRGDGVEQHSRAGAGARGSLPRGRAEGGADADAGSAQQRRGDLPLRRLTYPVLRSVANVVII